MEQSSGHPTLPVRVGNDTSDASPAGAHMCADLPVCDDDASGAVCSLSGRLALNGRGAGLNRTDRAEPKNGSGYCDLDLTPSSQVALGPS